MGMVLQDIRYAVRSLRRSPGVALAAVITLALGIGATTVIYSAVNRLLLNPLPFKGGDRLVYLWRQNPNASFVVTPSAAVVNAWSASAHSLEGIQPNRYRQFDLDRQGEIRRVTGIQVLPTLLSFLGVTPVLGRMFGPDEAKPGGPDV